MLSRSQVGKMLDVSYVTFAATIRVQKEICFVSRLSRLLPL